MTKVFRIDQITFDPIDIIAEDRDHAAQMFIFALMQGLGNRPGVTFDVSEWTKKRLKRFETHRRWADDGKAGVVWSVDDGEAWEMTSYTFDRVYRFGVLPSRVYGSTP